MKLQINTSRHGKWYDDACGTAFALELLGERWSLLIVRELMFGARRFTDLRGGLPGISAKVLSERLDGLEAAGITTRRQLAPPAAGQVYELTEWGYRADGAIMELGRWAARSPDHDPTLPLSTASLMMSFRTMFDPARAAGLAACIQIVVGREPFIADIRNQVLAVKRGVAEGRDAGLAAASAEPIAALVYGKVPATDLAEAGLAAEGDAAVLAAFVDLFHLPPKCERA